MLDYSIWIYGKIVQVALLNKGTLIALVNVSACYQRRKSDNGNRNDLHILAYRSHHRSFVRYLFRTFAALIADLLPAGIAGILGGMILW